MKIGASLASIFDVPDRRPIHEWARDFVYLSSPITRPGKFDCCGSRHFIPIFDALEDERTREVNVLKPVRGGGSLIGDLHLLSVLGRRPAPYMNVFQTDDDAKMHFYDRLLKFLKACPATRDLIPHRFDHGEIYLNSGHTLYTGGPGISNLQSKGVCHLRLDECWIYPLGRMGEAEARVGDYLREELSKILRISQAGTPDNRTMAECDWHRAWQRGEINEWEVACQHCGKYFEPIFTGARTDGSYWGITWEKHKLANGDWNIAKCVPTVRFECPHCAKPSMDTVHTKSEWNRTGRYHVVGEKNHKRRGFHWESVIDFPWDELVTLWLDAANAFNRGDFKPKMQFYQKRRAIFKDEEALLRGSVQLRRIAYEINSEWPDEKIRFLTLDRQDEDQFWWTVRAWSNERSRRLGFGKAYGFAECEALREKFKVQPNHTFCDSAFVPRGDHGVYAACCRYGWIAVRGENSAFFIHRHPTKKTGVQRSYSPMTRGDPGMGSSQQNKRAAALILFSKPQMNQIVQSLLDSGRWEEPMTGEPEMETEYALQMAARVKRTEWNAKTGEAKIYWRETKNDHARDLANMQVLGAMLAEKIPDPAGERLSKSEKSAE